MAIKNLKLKIEKIVLSVTPVLYIIESVFSAEEKHFPHGGGDVTYMVRIV